MTENGGGDLGPLMSRINKRQNLQEPHVGGRQAQSGGQTHVGEKQEQKSGGQMGVSLNERIREGVERKIGSVVESIAKEVITQGNNPYFIDNILPRIKKEAERLGMTTEELMERIKEMVEIEKRLEQISR
jgi:hypothetical protein